MRLKFQDLHIDYKDYSSVNKKGPFFLREEECIVCKNNKGRGLFVKNDKPVNSPFPLGARGEILGFVCLDCAHDFLNRFNCDLKDKKDISLFQFDLPKRYSKFYKNYKKGMYTSEVFKEIKSSYSQYIHKYFINIIEELVDLDYEYGENVHLGSEWRGWWLGLTGRELEYMFSWLETAIGNNTTPIDAYRFEKGNSKIPFSVMKAQQAFNNSTQID